MARFRDTGLADLALVIGLILAVTLPFADRAFHVDDYRFISVARNILRNPWRPFAEPINRVYMAGLSPAELEKAQKDLYNFETWVHPPLLPYFMALVAHVRGGIHERSQHLAYLCFTLLTGVSAYFLARRFTATPLWATLFLIASPVFILSAHSVMSEMPMQAFYQTAVLSYIYGIDRDRKGWLILSGVCMALALWTRYPAVTVVPVLMTYAVLRRARLGRAALPFILGALLFAAWEGQNYWRYREPHILAATSVAVRLSFAYEGAGQWAFLSKSIAFIIHAGSMLVFPFSALLVFLGSRRSRLLYGLLVWLSLSGLLWNPGDLFSGYSAGQLLLILFFFTVGLFITISVLARGLAPFLTRQAEAIYRNADRIVLSVWFGVVLVGSLVGLPFATARYLFPLALPLIFIVINEAHSVFGPTGFWLFSASEVVLMGALSLSMAHADYAHARVYKEFADFFSHNYETQGRVWFIGEHGFQYYMESRGYLFLPPDYNYPAPGDLLVKAREAAFHDIPAGVSARAQRLGSFGYEVNTPVRILDYDAKAGYYSHGWGFLPFYFSRSREIERFEVYRIIP